MSCRQGNAGTTREMWLICKSDETAVCVMTTHLIGLIVDVSCLLCSSALPGVWSFLHVTHLIGHHGFDAPACMDQLRGSGYVRSLWRMLRQGRTRSISSFSSRDVHEIMSHAEEGDLRLQGGTTAEDGSAEFGRLEIFYQGGWGHICIDNLDVIVNTSTLTVACRMLGYDGGAQVRSALVDELPTEGRVPVPVALDDLQCTGSEATLGACLGFQLDPDTAFSRSCPTLMLNVRCFSTTNSSASLCTCLISTA